LYTKASELDQKHDYRIDLLDELGLFIGEKPIFTKKQNSVVLPSGAISWLFKIYTPAF
jgi:hypothetical protein